MRDTTKRLSALAFFAQLATCWMTVLIVRHLDYNHSNMLYPFLLRLQAAYAEALRPVFGNSVGLTAVMLAAVSVSVVALVCVPFWRSNTRALRLLGYAIASLLVVANTLWFSTSALKRCC
jgi:hypothetical protein